MATTFSLSLVSLGVAIALTGCGAQRGYDGPTRDRMELATVESRSGDPLQIDGRDVGIFNSAVELLPGNHELLARVTPAGLNSPGDEPQERTIKFTVEGGKRYYIRGTSTYSRCVWIEDAETKQVVSTDEKGCGRRDVR